MTARDRVRALLTGFAAGVAGGLFGVGGGLVLIPLLTAFFGLRQHAAHGTSLAVIGGTALASIFVYAAYSNVAWSVALAVAITSLLTVRLGARWATRLSSRLLTQSFAIFLVAVAVRLLWKTPAGSGHPLESGAMGLVLDAALGACVGVLAGFMGVGGGILAVPAFTLLLGMSQPLAQGTSLAVILVTAPLGSYEHSRHGNVAWGLVPMLAVGAAAGAPLGSWLAQVLPHLLLTRSFAVFLLLNAVNTWLRARRQAAPVAAPPEATSAKS